jgi:hypothetical protein
MKKIILYLALFLSIKNFAQAIQYGYDANGNRTPRELYVVPCNNCPPVNQRTAAAPPTDSIQVIALQHGLNVFPNPTQDKVNLTVSNLKDDETTSAIVTDESGKVLYTAKSLQSQNEININTFNNGTYFVRVTIGKDVMVYKVIKVQ